MNLFNNSKTMAYNYVNSFAFDTNATYTANLKSIKTSIYANVSLGPTFMNKIGFDLSDMLISCYYNDTECNSTDFYLQTTYNQGNCYVFNFKTSATVELKQSSKTGRFTGLQLELFGGFSSIFVLLNAINFHILRLLMLANVS